MVLAYLFTIVELRTDGDPRPSGSLDDIDALASRDDLNILFVLVDTLRADRLGSWGYERDTSPLIDRLARTGVRFDRHLAQSSWTKCSMASLWTGLYPARSGVTRYDHVTSPEARLPAEILRDAGFRTAGIFRNGWVAPNFGFAQGFETYHRPRPIPLRASERRENPTLSVEGTDVSAIDSAISFLRAYGSERWFLYLHLMDIHEYVYDADSARFGTSYSDAYDQSILRLNRVLESLVAYLWEHDLADKTLIVIASDHGEAFGERGFEGHARNVYPEVTEVPLVLSFPFRLEPGLEVKVRTENVDIWPTILELAGLPPLEPSDGRSLVPLIRAAARGESLAEDGRAAIAHLDESWGREGQEAAPNVAVTSGDYRLVTRSGAHPGEELFDRRDDRFETSDVLAQNPEIAARLRERLRDYLESQPPWSEGTPTVELNEMELNQLRALGYKVP